MKKVLIPFHDSNLTIIEDIYDLVEIKYSKLFYAVIVHGSVATNDVIKYSDFDGLLIIKDQYLGSKELESFKKESMKIIYNFDPLQHHGWFQIIESDLKNYPENYLPVTTLEYAKLIYPKEKRLELCLKIDQDLDYKSSLIRMLNQFEKREADHWRPRNIYQVKSLLSQVMLIPCLYFSAINNDGIFKRESFQAVKLNFTKSEWMPIKTATDIRNNWNYKINVFQRIILKNSNKITRKIATRYLAPKIALNIQNELDDAFYVNLMLLVKKIKKDII